jgi:hypothetical protein
MNQKKVKEESQRLKIRRGSQTRNNRAQEASGQSPGPRVSSGDCSAKRSAHRTMDSSHLKRSPNVAGLFRTIDSHMSLSTRWETSLSLSSCQRRKLSLRSGKWRVIEVAQTELADGVCRSWTGKSGNAGGVTLDIRKGRVTRETSKMWPRQSTNLSLSEDFISLVSRGMKSLVL